MYKPNQHYSVEELVEVLLANTMAKETQPVHVCLNVSFVVSLLSLGYTLHIIIMITTANA